MKQTFSVAITGRRYYLEIDQSDEEVMRRAAKILNERVEELRAMRYECEQYDLLAMAALTLSVENEENKLKHKYSKEQQELDELAETVKRALEQ